MFTPVFAVDPNGNLMDAIAEMAKFAMVCSTILTLAFMVLLSLPKSQFRAFCLEIVSWVSMGASALYVVSPIDIIPDFIPVIGWVDDVGALVGGAVALFSAIKFHRERKLLAQQAEVLRLTEGE